MLLQRASARLSSAALLRPAVALRAGGGGLGPRWNIPDAGYHKYTYQPSIPDKHYNVAHNNYAPATLWLRARRPHIERVFESMYKTVKDTVSFVASPVLANIESNLPGFGFKAMGVLGFLLGYSWFLHNVSGVNLADAYYTLEKLRIHAKTNELWESGFFQSASEEQEAKIQAYNVDAMELNELFERTLRDATESRDFGRFVAELTPEVCASRPTVDPVSWRFNTMPYGRGSPDVTTFPDNGIDSPPAGALFYLDPGSSGDYIARQDNKPNPIRKARHLFTSAYVPPTK